ncbi:hypothetical protein EOD39_19286 [Acipenser ruthenus]|uniref:Pyrin domain-containing protein n=1 Tax=Acipenser ruthenus TaxID=7906 RepID=A0A444UYL4_ACIRT|nr:hypothetical protein EOD39_19286 [Acipenser ruthenus]
MDKKTVKDHIINALDDLRQSELKAFRHKLCDTDFEEGRSAQRETAESKKVFDDLMDSIQKKKYAVVELIEAKEKTALIEVEGLRKKIQQEISELRRQNNEIEQLSETKDNIQFLKTQLRKTQTEIQRQTQERLKELAELNQTIELVS